MRRVLMTADAVGGVWSYAMDLSRGLRGKAVEVTLAVMGPPPSGAQRAEAAAAGVGLTEIEAPLEWMDEPWAAVDRAGMRLLELERELAPDVVHLNGYCHGALPWRAPALVVAHSCVCSWWQAVHAESAPRRLDEYRRRVTQGLRAAARVVAPSAAMLRELAAEYGLGDSGCVIPNGSGWEPARDVAREPIVFAAGRVWDEAKNIGALCSAAPHLPWPVFVAGESGHPRGATTPPAGVKYLGALSRDALREWYARASVYALPARYEPFGLSILEAARSGCALVLGDIRSLRENWEGAAVFVPPDNRRALISAIQGLAADDGRRRRLGQAAAWRSQAFSVNRMVQGYLECYASLPVGVA